VVWRAIHYFAFGQSLSLPTLIGGALIVAGGLIVSFWKTAS
jgi:small multidrug resistance family-3 protein